MSLERSRKNVEIALFSAAESNQYEAKANREQKKETSLSKSSIDPSAQPGCRWYSVHRY